MAGACSTITNRPGRSSSKYLSPSPLLTNRNRLDISSKPVCSVAFFPFLPAYRGPYHTLITHHHSTSSRLCNTPSPVTPIRDNDLAAVPATTSQHPPAQALQIWPPQLKEVFYVFLEMTARIQINMCCSISRPQALCSC